MQTNVQKVWDPIVRSFHWLLVLTFLIAYLSGDELETLHAYTGYVISGLIVLRLVWGMVGTRYARFTNFVYSPSAVVSYLKSVLTLKPKRFIGHNPAGGWMIVLMLLTLIITLISGFIVYGAEESLGPLATIGSAMPHWMGEAFEEVHEVFANFAVLLIVVHIGGVAVESILLKENLVKSMWNGKKAVE